MRKRGSSARHLAVVAALFIVSPAFAAPAKKHKPKHPAPAAADSAPAPEPDAAASKPPSDTPPDADKPTPKPDAPADAKPTEDAPPKKADADKPPPKPDAPLAADLALKPETEEPAARDDAALAKREATRLGRREIARLAAGRTEVGVSASFDVASRHFTYSDPVGRLLAPYRLSVAPMVSFGLEAYPLASSKIAGLRDLGFRGHISRAFGLDSKTPDGLEIDTSWTRFSGELRERLLMPGPHAFELGIDVGLDASYFVMSTASKVAALLPTARTIAVRLGFDTKLLVAGQFYLMLGGAYLAPTSRGEIYDRFRKPTVGGVDGDFGLALGLTPGLEARLTARYTRYFATFKPRVGDPAVAGGALDEQLQFGLGVRYAN